MHEGVEHLWVCHGSLGLEQAVHEVVRRHELLVGREELRA